MEPCPFSGTPCPHKKCIHVTDVDNFKATSSKDMCVLCGGAYLAGENPNIAEEIKELVKMVVAPPEEVKPQPKIPIPACDQCGHSLKDIIATGKLGCGHCYEFFGESLLPLIEKCQDGANKHVGKKPSNKAKTKEELEKALKEAIKVENYELALEIKNKLKGM